MWTPHFAVPDRARRRGADQAPCSHCTDLLPFDEARGQRAEQVSAARQRVGGLFTGDTAPTVRAVMITWFTAATALAIALTCTR
ncbi:hypothetical protein GCM10010272_53970 [Streptomyces lateritius]|nr:hypothetical protein GCM10010272_53970 [Streptomyces lateritius]